MHPSIYSRSNLPKHQYLRGYCWSRLYWPEQVDSLQHLHCYYTEHFPEFRRSKRYLCLIKHQLRGFFIHWRLIQPSNLVFSSLEYWNSSIVLCFVGCRYLATSRHFVFGFVTHLIAILFGRDSMRGVVDCWIEWRYFRVEITSIECQYFQVVFVKRCSNWGLWSHSFTRTIRSYRGLGFGCWF